jgi:hypothetical protein
MCYEKNWQKIKQNFNHLEKMFCNKLKHLGSNSRLMGYLGIWWDLGGYFWGNVDQMLTKKLT